MTASTVLVPGLGLDARAWRGVRTRLGGPSRVVSLPALGLRARPGTDLHVERQGDRLIEALGTADDVVLVGHSASCPVVVDVAARSDAVVGLVLVGPVTDPRARTWPRMLTQWLRAASHERLWETGVLAPQYAKAGLRSIVTGMSSTRRYRTDVALAAVPVPTLVVRGQHDRIAPARWCAALARTPAVELLTVEAAGHMVPLTHPGAVASAVERLHSGRHRSGPRQRAATR